MSRALQLYIVVAKIRQIDTLCAHRMYLESVTTQSIVRQAVKFILLAQDYPKMVEYLTGLNIDNYNHGSFQQQPLIFPGQRGMLTPQQHQLPVIHPPPVALPT